MRGGDRTERTKKTDMEWERLLYKKQESVHVRSEKKKISYRNVNVAKMKYFTKPFSRRSLPSLTAQNKKAPLVSLIDFYSLLCEYTCSLAL